ncbi:MAG: LapD/MoxY N-terminal periplasmic domain-containing protein [Chromatiales bacterium]
MSLRFRLNLLITLMFLLILTTGALLVIHHARRAVAEETNSTANLTLNLLEVAFAQTGPDADPLEAVLRKLSSFEETRHLHIELIGMDSRPQRGYPHVTVMHQTEAPDWFVRLVTPPPLELRREVSKPGLSRMQIVIETDPGDEIREAWQEARALLGLLLAFCLLCNGLIYFTIGRSLKPIKSILNALDNIEQGDYKSRLRGIGLPELDVIAQKFNHVAEVLERSREQNRYLAQKSLAIQEQERRYLAHELHDELGQSISAIKALAVSIGQRTEGQRDLADSAHTIAETSQHVYDMVRGMMRRLRPVILDELGLVPALQNIVDDWNCHHEDAFCRFDAVGDFSNLSDEIKINVYRIVQEALTNITKHARATEADIQLKRSAGPSETPCDVLEVRIADNGVGMAAGSEPTGLGLLGMRERAEALGGHLELRTGVGQGVTLQIALPLAGRIQHE